MVYRTSSYTPLRPWQVRAWRFASVRFGRRGVDPAEVTRFLARIADDLDTVYAELARTQEQNARIKNALRQWQSRRVSSAYEPA